jgi:hypothetical protein
MFEIVDFERIKLPGAEGLRNPFWLSHRPVQICPAPTSSTDEESSSDRLPIDRKVVLEGLPGIQLPLEQ